MKAGTLLYGLAAVVLGALPASAAWAWGDTGHRLVGSLAVKALPKGLQAFLLTPRAAADVGELAREPDRWRNAGKAHDTMRDPAHFLDVDDSGRILGGPALDRLPTTRTDYETALRAAGTDSQKAGWLPYAIVDGYQQLFKDFTLWRADVAGEKTERIPARRAWITADRVRRERQIVFDLGVWAHYVGDASQPLHLTVHYNGWGDGPNPAGYTTDRIHVAYEGEFVRANVTAAAVAARMKPLRDCHCGIEARTADYLRATYATVIPFYELQKAGGLKDGDRRGADFTADRLAAAAGELRDLTVQAWNASAYGAIGYPPTGIGEIEAGRADAYALLYGMD